MISRPVPKLSRIIEEEMYVGFTAATGKGERSSAHYIMGWSFSSGGEHPVATKLNLSDLPRPPTNTSEKSAYSSKEIGLIVAVSAVTLILIALLAYFFIYKKRGETLEDWEVNHPHRMRYKELHSATDGFSEERIIGSGGFGTVFRGSLSSSLSDRITVKKITEGSEQGIREFVAEIECLGRLSHKNLVKLRGWCKRNANMLLVYDYIPNGSLDSLLHSVPRLTGTVLSWTMRFDIAKGIASGLLYLHEEGEQIVIHRDIKASNVLVDEDMNPGRFRACPALRARFTVTHHVIIGTPGYMAPELTSNGYPFVCL
uniref:non-specific serine/threonine protein kinase n=1 Tax=Brassica campestris TaxID=3711 RepID=M4DM56_BRACM